MKRIRAALEDGVKLAPGRMAILRTLLILEDVELRDRVIWNRPQQRSGERLIVGIHALDHEIVVPRPLAPNRWALSGADVSVPRHASAEQGEVDDADAD